MSGRLLQLLSYPSASSSALPAIVVSCLLLTGCATGGKGPRELGVVEPLQLEDRVLTVEDVNASPGAPDLLALDDDMRHFVDTYAGPRGSQRSRVMNIHQAVKSAGILDMRYDPFADGTAQDAFHSGTANCLSYANLFVALAREAGLNASYQWLEVRPQWTRMGERVAVRLHVNVLIKTNRGEQYMIDIDPLPSRDVAGSRLLSDADAEALYHNNIAMDALAEEDIETAWMHLVKALQLSPRMGQLWVNLGATYRRSGQLEAAERSYFRALSHDGGDRSAMNNMVVLYDQMGREEEKAYWVDRVERYRLNNPYYHTWLGDKAAEEGDWLAAQGHYDDALDRLPDDSRLLYSAGLIRYQLGDLDGASEFISRAMEEATLRRDVEDYRIQLEAVRREMLAETMSGEG